MFARLERERAQEQKDLEEQSEVASVGTMDETSEDSKNQWELVEDEDDVESFSMESKIESVSMDTVQDYAEPLEPNLPGMVYHYVDPELD